MKRIIISVCLSGMVAFALPARAAQHDRGAASVGVSAPPAHHSNTASNFEPMRASGNVAGTRFRSHNYSAQPYRGNRTATFHNQGTTFRANRVTSTNTTRLHTRNNATTNRNRTLVRNSTRTRNARVTNNWRSDRFRGSQYAAFRNYRRSYHDRGWWRSHYHNIVFVGGGWYYWDAGYWFPAWGYDPYAYYPYDGPIYGYNQMSPDQVIVDVQQELQRDGYYAGAIDGVLGPETRQAIAAFQADHGLATTAAIDQPTLSTLGLS